MSTEFNLSKPGDPVWEIATLYPPQGQWTVSEYLSLNTNRLIEFNAGQLEFLPMTTELHQLIALYLYTELRTYNSGNQSGMVLAAPFRIKVSDDKFREPDVLFMLDRNREKRTSQFWNGADLAIEVVSEDDPKRDLVTKRGEYAEAGITEYWIVDPRDRTVRVLSLDAGATEYRESGCYGDGQIAKSELLDGFEVDINSVFDQPT